MESAFEEESIGKTPGEEASTKLMLPLFLMLMIIMVMVSVRRFWRLGSEKWGERRKSIWIKRIW